MFTSSLLCVETIDIINQHFTDGISSKFLKHDNPKTGAYIVFVQQISVSKRAGKTKYFNCNKYMEM